MANTEAQRIAALIDHTILRADATEPDVRRVCAEAREYGFASVCVNGYWVPLVTSELAGSSVRVCTVAGFPLGAMSTEAKKAETEMAIRHGANEVDMVINVGALLSGERDSIQREIATLAAACHAGGALLKVILETCLLTDELKRIGCNLAEGAGADFVKTSTGFAKSGATVEDVSLMRDTVGDQIGVKASGGIRMLADLERMVAAGATRIGASASVAIIQSLAGSHTSAEKE